MAATQQPKVVNLVAGEDLNGDYGAAVSLNTSGQVVKSTTAGQLVIGVIAEDPERTTVAGDDRVPVALIAGGGVLRIRVGNAAVTAGQLLIASTTAGGVAGVANVNALTANQVACGVALEAGASSNLIGMLAHSVAK